MAQETQEFNNINDIMCEDSQAREDTQWLKTNTYDVLNNPEFITDPNLAVTYFTMVNGWHSDVTNVPDEALYKMSQLITSTRYGGDISDPDTNERSQILIINETGNIYTRRKQDNGTWTVWVSETVKINTDTAEYHNSIYRGKDITSYFIDGTLKDRINGTNGFRPFEDLFLGDYIHMSRAITAPGSSTTGSDYVTIIGFDTCIYNGSTSFDKNHIILTAGKANGGIQHFGTAAMNSSNTTVGGYVGSNMNTAILGSVVSSGSTASGATINQQLYAEFGSLLQTTSELLSNTITSDAYNRFGTNSGASSNWGWTDVQAVLMSEVEVYGSVVWSSSGYDTGIAKKQMPLFALSRSAMNNRSCWYWLKDVASASCFCGCGNGGDAYYYYASFSGCYVRPRFILS